MSNFQFQYGTIISKRVSLRGHVNTNGANNTTNTLLYENASISWNTFSLDIGEIICGLNLGFLDFPDLDESKFVRLTVTLSTTCGTTENIYLIPFERNVLTVVSVNGVACQ